jgi:hypothetical protein
MYQKMNSRLAEKKESVHLNKKKFIKIENGGLEVWLPTKNILL